MFHNPHVRTNTIIFFARGSPDKHFWSSLLSRMQHFFLVSMFRSLKFFPRLTIIYVYNLSSPYRVIVKWFEFWILWFIISWYFAVGRWNEVECNSNHIQSVSFQWDRLRATYKATLATLIYDDLPILLAEGAKMHNFE